MKRTKSSTWFECVVSLPVHAEGRREVGLLHVFHECQNQHICDKDNETRQFNAA